MALMELVMPKMGESIMEATILKWHKNPGDSVKMDETILEIATDKVDSEVPSTAEGVLKEILFKVDDVVPVGTVIATIETDAANAGNTAHPVIAETEIDGTSAAAMETSSNNPPPSPATANAPLSAGAGTNSVNNNGARFYSPLVLNIASKEGIGMAELEQISGTGNEGRVTKKDILAYVNNKVNTPQPATSQPIATQQATPQTTSTSSPAPAANIPQTQASANVEIVEMDRMRKLIAEHMVKSKATSPHVTSFTEADVTNIVKWREKNKNSFQKKYGEKITFTPIFIDAIVNSIKKYPMINVSVEGTNIIVKKDINIGMATALPTGNLIVPVIKNAATKNLLGLTKDVNSLAEKARTNKLAADDTQGGTFTLTNVGTFGSLMGTPIINQPQVAIMAVGAIKKRPMVLETNDGDVIAIRHMMYLSMSYDHRVVDGSLGAQFLTEVANELEAFDPDMEV